MSTRKAIILDRDGVLIEDKNYSYKIEDLEVLPGVIEGLKQIQENIKIEKTFFCPHIKEDNCDCRKPNPKFIKEIANQWDIDLESSWMIGDHPSDIQFGINGGCKTVYMITGHGEKHLRDLEVKGIIPTLIHSNFLEAIEEIRKII